MPRERSRATAASIATTDLAEYLEWDSRFFDLRIARVRAHHLKQDEIAGLLHWCSTEHIDCLYFLAASDDPETIRLAEKNQFHLVDIRVTFEHSLTELKPSSAVIRKVKAGDLAVLKRIAGVSFTDSRFYNDSHFSRECCSELYATWIERSCEGYADVVLVADKDGAPAGFVTCSLKPDGAGNIGLIAVDADSRDRGLGRELVNAALAYFRDCGATKATVITQGRNLASQRFYQRCGFLTASVQLWYHRWFS